MWYDVVVLAILAYTTIRGAVKGVVWQLAAIAGVVLCLVFAESTSALAGPYVKLEPPLNHWVVMFASYVLFSFLAFGVARLLNDWIEKQQFGEYNRHLGAILGFVKGVVICLVLTFFAVTVSADAREMLKHSRSGKAAAIIMDRIHPLMPEKLHDALGEYIHQLDSPDLPLQHAGDHHGHSHDDVLPGDSGFQLSHEFDDLLSRLPSEVQGDFRNVLERSLQQTRPEARPDLEQRLREALEKVILDERKVKSLRETLSQPPDKLIGAVSAWLTGGTSASTGGGTAGQVSGNASRRTQLLQEISTVYSSFPKAQEMIRQDIDRQLSGLSDSVALGVLEDLRADLFGAAQDPDPLTGMATSLQDRIVRQTAAADAGFLPLR
jgi:membrane protein required for colicin V production